MVFLSGRFSVVNPCLASKLTHQKLRFGISVNILRHMGQLIDCQVMNKHLLSLGAIELEREEFIQSLLSLKQENLLRAVV